MLFRELCGGLLAVAGKLPRASGSRRFSDRNRRVRLPITVLRHYGIALLLTSHQPSIYGRSRPAYPITAHRFLEAYLAGRVWQSADDAVIAAVCSFNR